MQAADLNIKYFDAKLSPKTLVWLKELHLQSDEVRQFVNRVFRLMHRSKFRAVDFSPPLGWALGFLPQRILPGAWGGLIPPITLQGRHSKIDEYARHNPWLDADRSILFLDLGCGFPPMTTVETAETFPDWTVVGADPSFGKYLVYDQFADYACFSEEGHLRYFQAGTRDPARWDALYRDPAATRESFITLFQTLLEEAHDHHLIEDPLLIQSGAGKLVVNPMKEYERRNLRFLTAGLNTAHIDQVDIARCFNVLIYFNAEFRAGVLRWLADVLKEGGLFLCGMNWAKSTQSRYSVYQKEQGALVPREFAISMDNLRPLGIVSWFALHDDDYETETAANLCGLLRSDEDFTREFDNAYDELLAKLEICDRDEEGYLSNFRSDVSPAELEARLAQLLQQIDEKGFIDRSVEVLKDAGIQAWRNRVGHLAVRPADLPFQNV